VGREPVGEGDDTDSGSPYLRGLSQRHQGEVSSPGPAHYRDSLWINITGGFEIVDGCDEVVEIAFASVFA